MGEELYQEFRPHMFSIAYRMVASASEAEDIVDGVVQAIRVVRNPDKLRYLERQFDLTTGEPRKADR